MIESKSEVPNIKNARDLVNYFKSCLSEEKPRVMFSNNPDYESTLLQIHNDIITNDALNRLDLQGYSVDIFSEVLEDGTEGYQYVEICLPGVSSLYPSHEEEEDSARKARESIELQLQNQLPAPRRLAYKERVGQFLRGVYPITSARNSVRLDLINEEKKRAVLQKVLGHAILCAYEGYHVITIYQVEPHPSGLSVEDFEIPGVVESLVQLGFFIEGSEYWDDEHSRYIYIHWDTDPGSYYDKNY